MARESLRYIKIFPNVNGKKKRIFSNTPEKSINKGWNKFIMEIDFLLSQLYIYIYIMNRFNQYCQDM